MALNCVGMAVSGVRAWCAACACVKCWWNMGPLWGGGEVTAVLRQWAGHPEISAIWSLVFVPFSVVDGKGRTGQVCVAPAAGMLCSLADFGEMDCQENWTPRLFFPPPVQMPGVIYLLDQCPWELSQWLLKWGFIYVKSNVLWDLGGRKFSSFLASGWWKTINNNKCGAHHWNSKGLFVQAVEMVHYCIWAVLESNSNPVIIT